MIMGCSTFGVTGKPMLHRNPTLRHVVQISVSMPQHVTLFTDVVQRLHLSHTLVNGSLSMCNNLVVKLEPLIFQVLGRLVVWIMQ